jgi:hypothetical protein
MLRVITKPFILVRNVNVYMGGHAYKKSLLIKVLLFINNIILLGKGSHHMIVCKCVMKLSPIIISDNPGNFPMGNFLLENFREIQETSRRETFSRRISGNPGNFPPGKFLYAFYTTRHYNFL